MVVTNTPENADMLSQGPQWTCRGNLVSDGVVAGFLELIVVRARALALNSTCSLIQSDQPA